MDKLGKRQSNDEPPMAVVVSDNQIAYFMNGAALDNAFGQDVIQKGLALAGAWSNLGVSEEEMIKALDKIRHESEPTPSIEPM